MRINETRKRSFLKAGLFRVIEIAASTAILHFKAGLDTEVAFRYAVVLELTCFAAHYGFERIWNKINYGRNILDK